MTKIKSSLSLLAVFVAATAAQQLKAVTVLTTNFGTIAGPFTSTGTLANQGVALEATFSLGSASALTIFTTSYGGGTNADGTAAARGGFMPSLVLYNASANYVAGATFPSPLGATDPITGLNGDAYIKTATLSAGAYTIALSDFLVQQSPTATNLSDGFVDYGSGTSFSDAQGNLRTGSYALNISGVSSPTAAPEPATFSLLIPAIGIAVFLIRKRQKDTKLELLQRVADLETPTIP